MTIVLRTPDGKIKVLTKGADSVLVPLLRNSEKNLKDVTLRHL